MKEDYNSTVLSHFNNPSNIGEIKDADAVGVAKSKECGDLIKLSIKLEGDRIIDAKAKTFGCAAAIASASVTTELMKNKTLCEVAKLKNSDIVDALGGLPEDKVRCSVLTEDAVKAALEDYKLKGG